MGLFEGGTVVGPVSTHPHHVLAPTLLQLLHHTLLVIRVHPTVDATLSQDCVQLGTLGLLPENRAGDGEN